MNIEKFLILVKGEDKTEDIEWMRYEHQKWQIKFFNSTKPYSYNYLNIEKHDDPLIKDAKTCVVYENNLPISGVVKILIFGDYVRLIFGSGYQKVYRRASLIIEETSLTRKPVLNCFEYFKRLASFISVKDEKEQSFLSRQYGSLTAISPRSVLASYLEGVPFRKGTRIGQVIFPFGFNMSQKAATERALAEQASVIEGPPGTGKTQTILNIISNAVLNGKTVAVVSNNNSATANVLEKMKRYEVGFLAAYLGNKENRVDFFSKQPQSYPDMSVWKLNDEVMKVLAETLRNSQQKLNEMLSYQNELADVKQELSQLETEYEYFKQYISQSNFTPIDMKWVHRLKADKILKFILDYKLSAEEESISLKRKLYNMFSYRIFNLKFYKFPVDAVITSLQQDYYEVKSRELQANIDELSGKLNAYKFERAMNQYSQNSMKLFKANLAKRYTKSVRRTFSDDALWKEKEFEKFIEEYPVILSTTHSLRNCAAKNYLFDYVLMDEASQVDLVTGALALSCAKNVVIVGDTKQLPNVIPAQEKELANKIFQNSGLNPAYNYAEHSLLTSIMGLYKEIPKTLLKEHYRCHPKIIEFCNKKFYNNELIILTDEEKRKSKPLVLYKTAKGNHARSRQNQRQRDMIFNEIFQDQQIDEEKATVGIISPFRQQANELQQTIGDRSIEADTVHKYQGRERNIIILSTVANEIQVNDFADDPNLINVAVSRAVNQLIVVTAEGAENWKGTNIGDLVRYIKYHNFEVIESQIYSVFDLLYTSYSEKLLDVVKRGKAVSLHKSENLMNAVIEKVLSEQDFQSLDHVLHQPLRMLIKDPVLLNDEEKQYAMNILTHTDFVIFNMLDKMPVLVVEVDGHAFHANNPVQLKRDELKDRILEKYGIPIIRMKTTGSGEEGRLKQKLSELIGED
ncbi:AAA domain-containing protein [Neobacillus sp. YIM B06451]|uniref:AAA domain-containing protein n=1 Tax=Neobacillus sp. YIM B06451 TaxID=3070994 RepID=UPI002930E50C|nr:AAA domain-containing protein [Neobacillus sp. YIM B06451]